MARSLSSYLRGGSDGILGPLLAPLIGLAALGVAGIVAFRKRLDEDQARLAVAAFGWVVVGFWVVVVASYRPNRYVMPIVPGLAILAAIGLRLVAGWASEWLGERLARRQIARPASARSGMALAACLAMVIAAGPGLGLFYSWNHHATNDLPRVQDRFAALVPAGERVAGRESGLFLMKSRAITIEVQLTQTDTAANAGDLYSGGVRWYLQPTTAPVPPGVPAEAWAQRETLGCVTWNRLDECLIKLP